MARGTKQGREPEPESAHATEAADWQRQWERLTVECERLKRELEEARTEHERALAETEQAAALALERQVATATEMIRSNATASGAAAQGDLQKTWESERAQFLAEREQLIADRDRAKERLAESLAEVYDSLRSESGANEQALLTQLASLKQASIEWDEERRRLQAEAERAHQRLTEASAEQTKLLQDVQSLAENQAIRTQAQANAEIARLQEQIQTFQQSVLLWETERNTLQNEKKQAVAEALERGAEAARESAQIEFAAKESMLRAEYENRLKTENSRTEQAGRANAQAGEEMARLVEQVEGFEKTVVQWDVERATLRTERDQAVSQAREQSERASEDAARLAAQIEELRLNSSQQELEKTALRNELEQAVASAQDRNQESAEAARSELAAKEKKMREEMEERIREETMRARTLLAEAEAVHAKLQEAQATSAAAERSGVELREQSERLNAELQRLEQAVAQGESERSDLTRQLDETRGLLTAATGEQAQLAEELKHFREAAQAEGVSKAAISESLAGEVSRVEVQLRALSQSAKDANTEFSEVIRKNVERADLESYLRGIRFALSAK